MPSINDVENLLEQAAQLENYSPTRIDLLLQAIDIADSIGDIELGYEARDELIEAAAFGGRSELLFPAFAWVLGQLDRGALSEYTNWNILWKYKWAINDFNGFPRVSAQQIEAAIQDFATRLEKIGQNSRILHFLKWRYQHHRGDKTLALEQMNLWRMQPRGSMSDCHACETNFHAEFLAWLGDHQAALEIAEPILLGKLRCGSVPSTTYAIMLRSCLKLGHYSQAMQMHRKGYRAIKDDTDHLASVGLHLEFLVYSQNLPSAIRLLERHLPWALVQQDLEQCFTFYLACKVLCEALVQKKQELIKMQLSGHFTVQPKLQGYLVLELYQYFCTELEQIAALFDTRNQNTYFAARIAQTEPWLQVIPHIPMRQSNPKNEDI